MRGVYYQSVGNPLQVDRLPDSRPAIEMLPPEEAGQREEKLYQLAVSLSLAAAGAVTMLVLYRPAGWSALEPYDLLICGPIVAALASMAIVKRQVSWLLQPAFLVSLVFLCANQRMPWTLQVLVASLAVGLLSYCFGAHCSHVQTASPVPLIRAYELRSGWHRQLLIMATIGGVLTGMTLASGWLLMRMALVTLPIAAMAVPKPPGLRATRARVLWHGLMSWYTYDAPPVPSLLQSPVGSVQQRRSLPIFAAVLATIVMTRYADSPFTGLMELGETPGVQAVMHGQDRFEQLKYGVLGWSTIFIAMVTLPVVLPWMLASCLAMPILLEAAAERDRAPDGSDVSAVIKDVRRSPDLVERQSIYMGRVVRDGSSVLIPRTVFREHAHGLGDSGSGKTSLFLCPLIEQMVMWGDCSVIVLDLKADTLELLATLRSAAEAVRRERGIHLPLKFFSNQLGKSTFAFNPMTQPFWSNFDLLTKTDILCGATGLTYGTDYGQGYYSSANAAILYHTLKTFPFVNTFRDIAECIGVVITTAKKQELHPEIRKAGVHVHEVMKRLASCEALNVTDSTGHSEEVVEQAIDLSRIFREPQLLYFHLSATLSPSGAPEIARLKTYMTLAAATQTERKVPVFLFIDEFQRMVAGNLEYMLQLARSMGVGVILANQSMEDLKQSTINLIPPIEANCRMRQWFSVSSSDDQQRLINSSGLTVDRQRGASHSTKDNGGTSVTYSATEQVVPRITINDILLTSDHPFRSILRVGRGAGYAQYGGMPVIIESSFHISEEEYRRRQRMPWPTAVGAFVQSRETCEPREPASPHAPHVPDGWTEETIKEDGVLGTGDQGPAIEVLFDDFRKSMKSPPTGKRRKRS